MEARRIDGAKLRRARERAGYPTQAKAADALGLSRSRLNNWEMGVAVPSAGVLASLMDAYGVRFIDDLLTEVT